MGSAIYGTWAQNLTITHNEIGYSPYSGIQIDGDMTTNPNIRKAFNISYNYVHDVMSELFDGAAIYSNSEMYLDSTSSRSQMTNNYIKNSGDSALYTDAYSSYWNVSSNVVDNVAANWVSIWTPSIHDEVVNGNYTNTSAYLNSGTNCPITNTTKYTGSNYPAGAQTIINNAGLEPAYQNIKSGGPTPTPTPTPAPGGDITYGFEDQPNGDNQALNGVHSGIDFGSGNWLSHTTNWYGFGSKFAAFSTAVTSRTFTIPSGKCLKSIKVSGDSGGTYSISDGVNTTKSGNITNNTPTTVTTGWTSAGSTITVYLSASWSSGIDDIVYGNP